MALHSLQRAASTTRSLAHRLFWFALIWLASVAALAVVATLIRWAIKP